MRTLRLALLFFGCDLLIGWSNGLWAQTAGSQAGISVAELRSFARQLTPTPGRLQSLQFLQSKHGPLIGVARWSDGDGWKIFLYETASEGIFAERWHSGKLPDSFQVSYPGALKVFQLGNEDGLEFQGCAPHSCPEVFSTLLYVPSINKAFVVTSTFGKASYSPDVLRPQNLRYKRALDELTRTHSAREK